MLLFDYIVGIVHVRKKKVLNILFSSYQDKDLDFYHLLKVTNIFKYHYELMDWKVFGFQPIEIFIIIEMQIDWIQIFL